MLTILTTFKPFIGDDAHRQINAIVSWLCLSNEIEIMVFGDPIGVRDIVVKYGLVHYPNVPSFENRLVRTDAIFEIGQKDGRHSRQAYVNGDMVLGDDFVRAFCAISYPRFLLVGQRWDYDVGIDFKVRGKTDVQDLQAKALKLGKLHPASGMDYFGYLRGTLTELKPTYVGAVMWDNYMVQHCRAGEIPVIDVSNDIVAVHQNHGYSYLKGGGTEFCSGAPSQINKALAGNPPIPLLTLDATHVLRAGKVWPSFCSVRHLRHKIVSFPLRNPRWSRWTGMFRMLGQIIARVGGEQ